MPLFMLILAAMLPMLPVSNAAFCRAAVTKEVRTCATLHGLQPAATCLALTGHDESCKSLAGLQDEQFCDAVALRDDSACQALEEGDARLICHALISNNSAYCHDDGEPDNKALCTALTMQDNKTCDTIEGADTKSFCHAFVKNDAALCPSGKTAFVQREKPRIAARPLRVVRPSTSSG